MAADRVMRVVAGQPVKRLPLLPPAIRGVVAYGGKVVPVLHLRRLLDLPDGEETDGELLLVATGSESYALSVDRVVQIGAYAALSEIDQRGRCMSSTSMCCLRALCAKARRRRRF